MNSKKIIPLMVLCCALSLSACVSSVQYMTPTASNGLTRMPHCGYSQREIVFASKEKPWVKIKLQLRPEFKKLDLPPRLELEIVKEFKAQIFMQYEDTKKHSADIRVKRAENVTVRIQNPFIHLSWQNQSQNLMFEGLGLDGLISFSDKGIKKNWNIPAFNGDTATVQISPIQLNNELIEFSPIKFEQTNETILMPINC
jgi:hypothetical protein